MADEMNYYDGEAKWKAKQTKARLAGNAKAFRPSLDIDPKRFLNVKRPKKITSITKEVLDVRTEFSASEKVESAELQSQELQESQFVEAQRQPINPVQIKIPKAAAISENEWTAEGISQYPKQSPPEDPYKYSMKSVVRKEESFVLHSAILQSEAKSTAQTQFQTNPKPVQPPTVKLPVIRQNRVKRSVNRMRRSLNQKKRLTYAVLLGVTMATYINDLDQSQVETWVDQLYSRESPALIQFL